MITTSPALIVLVCAGLTNVALLLGPTAVVTGLGVYRFHEPTGEMELASLHPGVSLELARENTGWDLQVAQDLGVTPPPSDEEIRLIREELDPEGTSTR